MKITFLSDNKTENSNCTAEWGLSVLIESQGNKVLFDVGASPIFAENAKNLGVDLSDVEAVAISHGHFDHTGGMESFCEINKLALLYMHKNAISPSFGTDKNGRIEDSNCGIRWTKEFADKIKNRTVFTENVVKINDSMTLVGNITPLKEYPMTEKFYRPSPTNEEKYLFDHMEHEQFLVVKEEKGLYVFSGCSHTGMMAIINRIQELFPGEKIVALIAGMHLYPLKADMKEKIVNAICNLGIETVFPVHCTGIDAILMFKQRLGNNCIIASAGEVYEI
ncbi:MAG: MBL fold metallo-hydrolase [Firmicutes bacterium]|nr:MBL fold metallo-hydrolase [Bacillota bacterium]